MNIEISEALWLDISKIYTLTEITELSGLPLTLLNHLIELDAIPACDDLGSAFDTKALERACAARRLHHDLELDAGALALVLQLLSRVRDLEGEIHSLQARLPQHLL